LLPGDPHLHGTPPAPMPPTSPGGPNPVADQEIPPSMDKKAVKSG